MPKSTRKKVTPKKDDTPKCGHKPTQGGVLVSECALDQCTPFQVGNTLWFPMPRHITVELGKDGILGKEVFDLLKCGHTSVWHSFVYKFGGVNDAGAGDTVTLKDGTKRAKSKAEKTGQMRKRAQAIRDGVYRKGSSGFRGIAVPDDIAEMCQVVRAQIEETQGWVDTFLRPFRANAMTQKDVIASLAATMACHNHSKKPTRARVESAKAHIIATAEKNMSQRSVAWNPEDNDILNK